MRHKRGISGRIYQIDLGIFVFEVGKIVVERDFTFYRVLFVIRNGRAFIDLSPAMCCSGDVEQA